MTFSRVLFVGLGGAGQRHLRILRQLLPDATMLAYRLTRATPLLRADFTVDDGGKSVEEQYSLTTYDSLAAAMEQRPDLTVISTPTAHHREPMMMAINAGSGVLVEKPWAEDLKDFAAFRAGITDRGLPFLISFQRRFHPQISQARELVRAGGIGRPIVATFTVYSNVPVWHPYEDWRTLYAVRPDLGGGVLLTEIHEIDLANWFFGIPKSVFCVGGNRGPERLDVEDTVQLTVNYEALSVQITLCFMHGAQGRNFHIAGTKGDISWTASGTRLVTQQFPNSAKSVAEEAFAPDAMFEAQARAFVHDWSRERTYESLTAAEHSLAVVEAARRSMVSGRAEKTGLT
jgi:predicted dehydrogenase